MLKVLQQSGNNRKENAHSSNSLLTEISGECLMPQLAVATSHLYRPPSSTDRSRIVRNLQELCV